MDICPDHTSDEINSSEMYPPFPYLVHAQYKHDYDQRVGGD